MKQVLSVITIILFSHMAQSQQRQSYESLWKQVAQLENEALTKSAMEVANTISAKATNEGNRPQQIKALLFISKYMLVLEEDAQLTVVQRFKKHIAKAKAPTKNVLQSYLANMYWQYFQQNRYRFYNRTETVSKVDSTDFRTWDLNTLFKEIGLYFEASLENEGLLQKTTVSEFDPILNKQKGSEMYRPTLYDLLAHTALDFYTSDENGITRPADKFELNDPDWLCSGKDFVNRAINTTDETSLQAKALCTYQKLMLLHINAKQPEPFVEVDLERLDFIYKNATFADKEQQLLDVLTNAANAYKNSSVSGLYLYEKADLLDQMGNGYDPKNEGHDQWKKKEALALCNDLAKQFPKSRAAEKAIALKQRILEQSLSLLTESHVPANTVSRLLVQYKNLNALTLSARRISIKEIEKLQDLYPENKKLDFLLSLPIAATWEASLKNEGDYQNHSTEIRMPALENGQYVVLARPKDNDNGAFSHALVQATDLAVVETQTNGQHNFQVIDRNNGAPIANAQVTLTYRKNYNGPQLSKSFTTDKLGTVSLPKKPKTSWNNIGITVTHGKQKGFFKEYYINRNYDASAPPVSYPCFIFTDRSIYRPGQPLYFKGIAIKQEQGTSSILEGTPLTLEIRDVNGQVLTAQEFKTSEYGSFSGEYVLPNNGLTGQFSIGVSSKTVNLQGYTGFSVEEYKRPKFETLFKPVTETYAVNDSIRVQGTATAYAGSSVTDAKTVYRVRRVVEFPRWFYWRFPQYNLAPQEIAHGETVTDASGNYEIVFKALPDKTIKKENLPVFKYEVTAEVTDINGETRTATTTVNVGYHTLTATAALPKLLDKNALNNTIVLTTNNLNGEFVPTKGSLKMYKLKAPDRVLRPRPWPAPDYPGFDPKEFQELYPHDPHSHEDDPARWEKGDLVWQTDFDTEKSKEIDLKNTKNWASGKYLLLLETQDKHGQPVKDMAHTTVFSDKDKQLADHQRFQIKTDQETYAPGDKAKVTVYSAARDLTVTLYVEKDREIIATHIMQLNNNAKTISLPVTDADYGGFAVTYSYAAFNAFENGSIMVEVPYPSTELQIEAATFRDKLRPGTDETWAFTIKGPKGDAVAAEVLASMYDASLDAFRPHAWNFYPFARPTYYPVNRINARHSFALNTFTTYLVNPGVTYPNLYFDSFNWFGLQFGNGYFPRMYGLSEVAEEAVITGYAVQKGRKMNAAMAEMPMDDMEAENDKVIQGTVSGVALTDSAVSPEPKPVDFNNVQVRKNLQETAFFFPQLQTDKDGNVSFSFTAPEALTQWNLQLLAHTKSLESAVKSIQTVTQKELMVTPNAPRFLREGDALTLNAKIANLSEKSLSGQAKLVLTDAFTGKDITGELMATTNANVPVKDFTVDAKGNARASWQLKVPKGLQAVQYKIMAIAGDFSDGEQNVLPVLTNRMLVTETLPMWVGSDQTKTFTLEKLKHNASKTLAHHKLSLEVTSNPAWYAVQALPYLMEYPYDCNEQTFARFYANTLASHIAKSDPRIQEVFRQWANADALISNLEKNEELKSILIQETPWLRDAQSETEQKKRIALLFNLNKMENERSIALKKLRQNQNASGAWPWFNGGPDSRFITQYIVAGLGHLNHLGAAHDVTVDQQMVQMAMDYLDTEFVAEYERMKKYATDLDKNHLSPSQIYYLYMRGFFKEVRTPAKVAEIMDYYKGQAKKYWKDNPLYTKGMLALILHRSGDSATANLILRSLKENSITSEELGMYWKENTSSWHWYQAPVETQALLIEAFSEIAPNDVQTVDNLKIWLLKNKQTSQWKTTKATSEAVYALLLQGSDWLSVTDAVEVTLGGKTIDPGKLEGVRAEAGTGYYKTSWSGAEIKPEMAQVSIAKKGKGIAWGALYWQYFEDLDAIAPAVTPLQLKKQLFLKKNTDTGEKLTAIDENAPLAVGDLVRVRIELRADRTMEFVHMKDMRAAGFEPVNVLSHYQWQDGLGYYQSTKDASTNFFFDVLPKGVYVFEYDLRANNAGNFSNGITTIQSMYAPEFSSHSEGLRVQVGE